MLSLLELLNVLLNGVTFFLWRLVFQIKIKIRIFHRIKKLWLFSMNVFIECFMFLPQCFHWERVRKLKVMKTEDFSHFFYVNICVWLRRGDFFCSLAHIDLNSFSFLKHQNSMIKSTLETVYSSKVISERKKMLKNFKLRWKKWSNFQKSSSFVTFPTQLWKLSKFIFRSTLYRVKINFILHKFLLKINYVSRERKKTYLIIVSWWEKLSQFTWKSQWLSQFFIITDNFAVVSKFDMIN